MLRGKNEDKPLIFLGISHFQTNKHSFLINMGGFLTMGGFNYHGQVSEPFFIHLSLYPMSWPLICSLSHLRHNPHFLGPDTWGSFFTFRGYHGIPQHILLTDFTEFTGKNPVFQPHLGVEIEKIWRLEHRFLWRFPMAQWPKFSAMSIQMVSRYLWRNLPKKSTLQMQSFFLSDHNMNMICVSPKMNTSNTPPVF